MRRMITRQAILFMTYASLLAGLSACSPSNDMIATQTVIPTTATLAVTSTPSPTPAIPTPLTCLTVPGLIKQDVVATTNPPQEFLIYLPPCYENYADARFPALYLLHGITYNQDQWVRIGTPEIADQLIHSNEVHPFIIVFPDDRYWNSPASAGFGDRLINRLIPYVDENYRTIPNRKYRSLGGLSYGGGLTVELGFEHPELFGSLGLHSPAVLKENAPYVENNIKNTADETRPRLWFDIGDRDTELGSGQLLEEILTRNNYIHEFHLFSGDHTEKYWRAHVEQYLRWYAQGWLEKPVEQ